MTGEDMVTSLNIKNRPPTSHYAFNKPIVPPVCSFILIITKLTILLSVLSVLIYLIKVYSEISKWIIKCNHNLVPGKKQPTRRPQTPTDSADKIISFIIYL